MNKKPQSTAGKPSVKNVDPVFTKDQLLKAKTLDVPVDAVKAVLKDGETYTREQAIQLVTDFLKKEVV